MPSGKGKLLLLAALALTFPGPPRPGIALSEKPQAVEVGIVEWGRDFDGALEKSRGSGTPVLVLFQEVPGCAGCRKFGREVLSHPGLAAAIESEFIPVLVYNNRPGKDREILERYGEPSWSYQVIRFLDGEGSDIIPRRDRVWTLQGVARRMISALEAAGRSVAASIVSLASGAEPREGDSGPN